MYESADYADGRRWFAESRLADLLVKIRNYSAGRMDKKLATEITEEKQSEQRDISDFLQTYLFCSEDTAWERCCLK